MTGIDDAGMPSWQQPTGELPAVDTPTGEQPPAEVRVSDLPAVDVPTMEMPVAGRRPDPLPSAPAPAPSAPDDLHPPYVRRLLFGGLAVGLLVAGGLVVASVGRDRGGEGAPAAAATPAPAPAAAAPAAPAAAGVDPARLDAEKDRADKAEAKLADVRKKLAEVEKDLKGARGRLETEKRVYMVQKGELELAQDRHAELRRRYDALKKDHEELMEAVRQAAREDRRLADAEAKATSGNAPEEGSSAA